jgi:hypothetical protein
MSTDKVSHTWQVVDTDMVPVFLKRIRYDPLDLLNPCSLPFSILRARLSPEPCFPVSFFVLFVFFVVCLFFNNDQ